MGKRDKKTEQDQVDIEGASQASPTAAEQTEDSSISQELSLEDQLESAKAAAREADDRYLRAKAELDNYRKRAQRDLVETREYIKGVTAQEFFSPFDHFRMAMAHVEETPDVETMKQGMGMILSEFQRSFEALGIELVDATGREFDPEQHEAVAQEPSEDVPAGTVLRQWKCGYRMGGKLLRPASVVVSSGPSGENEAASAE